MREKGIGKNERVWNFDEEKGARIKGWRATWE